MLVIGVPALKDREIQSQLTHLADILFDKLNHFHKVNLLWPTEALWFQTFCLQNMYKCIFIQREESKKSHGSTMKYFENTMDTLNAESMGTMYLMKSLHGINFHGTRSLWGEPNGDWWVLSQSPVLYSFHVSYDGSLYNLLIKQSNCKLFETAWRPCDIIVTFCAFSLSSHAWTSPYCLSLHDDVMIWEHVSYNWPFVRGIRWSGTDWFHSQTGSNTKLCCSLCCTHEHTIEQTIDLLVIWDPSMLMWRNCNERRCECGHSQLFLFQIPALSMEGYQYITSVILSNIYVTGRELRSGVKCIVMTIVTGSLWSVWQYHLNCIEMHLALTIPSH